MSLLDDLDGNLEEEKEFATKKQPLEKMLSKIESAYETFVPWYVLKRHEKFGWGSDSRSLTGTYKISVKQKIGVSVTPEVVECYLHEYNKLPDSKVKDYVREFSAVLIQNAYDNGYNFFHLPVIERKDPNMIPKDLYLCYWHLHGTKDSPINIIIKGDFVQTYGSHLNHATIRFSASKVSECAENCKNSKIVFEGDASHSASNSENCDVYLYGVAKSQCGEASKNTRFYSPHKTTLKEVSKSVALENCSFYLIEDDGSHKEVTF